MYVCMYIYIYGVKKKTIISWLNQTCSLLNRRSSVGDSSRLREEGPWFPASNKHARLEGNVDEAALEVNLVQCLFPPTKMSCEWVGFSRRSGDFLKWWCPKMDGL